jgi:hypothetical protein
MPIIATRASAAYGAGFSRVVTAAVEPVGSFDFLSTVTVPSGGLASVTFDGIPTTYRHLQIRGIAKTTSTGWLSAQFNSDTTAGRYQRHFIFGDGGGGTGGSGWSGTTSSNNVVFGYSNSSSGSSYNAFVWDILDYSNVSKGKTTRSLMGLDINGTGGFIELVSGGYFLSGTQITTIRIAGESGNLAEFSKFSLYGVK